jgi:hypothetical protein
MPEQHQLYWLELVDYVEVEVIIISYDYKN